jgi:hypothetical protein
MVSAQNKMPKMSNTNLAVLLLTFLLAIKQPIVENNENSKTKNTVSPPLYK